MPIKDLTRRISQGGTKVRRALTCAQAGTNWSPKKGGKRGKKKGKKKGENSGGKNKVVYTEGLVACCLTGAVTILYP